ncbi:MAG: hypothetical protein RL307_129, partial [Pseudomonadota bacterium]
ASGLGLPASGRAVDAGLFADILSRHWQHLAQNQRQDLAASADATLSAAGRVAPPEHQDLSEIRALDSRTQELRRADEPEDAQQVTPPQAKEHRAAATLDALDSGRLPLAPAKWMGSEDAPLDASMAQMTDDGLMVMPLGERINIVTPPQTQVNEQSVADFARSMGMSELQIEQLFGTQTAEAVSLDDSVSTVDRLRTPGLNGSQAITTTMGGSGLNVLSTGESGAMSSPNMVASPVPATLTSQALSNLSISPALAAQAAQATQATQDSAKAQSHSATNATTVDVLTIMDAEFAPEVWQALQSRIGGSDSKGLLTGGTLSTMGASGSAALAIPSDRSALMTEDGVAMNLPGMGNAMNAANRTRSGVGAQAGLLQAAAPDAQEAYDELNQKFTTELASRINQQINSGEWKMKFALKPASLGHLDVQLEMRDGKLSAVFQTDNAMTQDLLSTGSQRLKDALAQLGHSNASVWVGSGGSGQAQGQGRGHQPGSSAPHAMSAPSDSSSGSTSAAPAPRSAGSSQSSNHLDLFA